MDFVLGKKNYAVAAVTFGSEGKGSFTFKNIITTFYKSMWGPNCLQGQRVVENRWKLKI